MSLSHHFSRVQLVATPWTAAHQAPQSMGFCRQECWSGLPFPSPGDLPDPGLEPASLASPALTGGFFTSASPRFLFGADNHGLKELSALVATF